MSKAEFAGGQINAHLCLLRALIEAYPQLRRVKSKAAPHLLGAVHGGIGRLDERDGRWMFRNKYLSEEISFASEWKPQCVHDGLRSRRGGHGPVTRLRPLCLDSYSRRSAWA